MDWGTYRPRGYAGIHYPRIEHRQPLDLCEVCGVARSQHQVVRQRDRGDLGIFHARGSAQLHTHRYDTRVVDSSRLIKRQAANSKSSSNMARAACARAACRLPGGIGTKLNLGTADGR